jgi:cytochrome c oxidase subunit 2
MRHFVIVAVLILIMTGLVYYGLNSVGLFPAEASQQAQTIDWLFDLEIIGISFLFSLIVVPLAYSLIRFRQKPGDESFGAYITGNTPLELVWTLIPLIIVLVLAYLGAWSLGDTLRVDPTAMKIEVTAFQWAWRFHYPDYDITTNELYLLVDKQVLLEMESPDVIHSFWVPEFRVKQDIVPGLTTELRITPTIIGNYTVRCSELCGTQHAYMNAPVMVVNQEDFDTWVSEQQVAAVPSDEPDPDRGENLARQNGCFACHTTDGTVEIGPTWQGLYGSEVELSDGSFVTADGAFLAESILDPNATIVAGYPSGAMPPYTFTQDQIADLIAFIESLK